MSMGLRILAASLALLASEGRASSEVTLHNLTSRDLIVAHAQGPGAIPLQAATHCALANHGLCPPEPRPFGRRVTDGGVFPVPGRPVYEYWLKGGESVTFTFEGPGEEVKGEVYLQDPLGKLPASAFGLVIYTL